MNVYFKGIIYIAIGHVFFRKLNPYIKHLNYLNNYN